MVDANNVVQHERSRWPLLLVLLIAFAAALLIARRSSAETPEHHPALSGAGASPVTAAH